MSLEKKFLTIALLAIALAVPVAFASQQRVHQIKIEKSQNKTLQIQLESKQELLDKKQQQLEQRQRQLKEEKQRNEELEQKLQAKREAQARLAAQAAVKPPVRVLRPSYDNGGGCEQYRNLVAQYNWDARIALAIMQAESGCRANASSPTDDHGLMQINHGDDILGSAVYIPAVNIKYAYEHKYLKGGWTHWTVYNTGAYLRYL